MTELHFFAYFLFDEKLTYIEYIKVYIILSIIDVNIFCMELFV